MNHLKEFYINGEWVAPNQPNLFPVVNPATEEIIDHIHLGNQHDVNKAVDAAKIAFSEYRLYTVQERIELLTSLLNLYLKRYNEIADAMTMEMGAPTTFSKEFQAETGSGIISMAIETLKKFHFSFPVGDATVYKEPIGVCGLITPWNWPINQMAIKVIPALATGCTIVLKPSVTTPLSAHIFSELIDEAGFPKGVYNHINGTGTTIGHAISSHPDIDLVSFTGSTNAGIQVAKTAADTVKRVAQELGGKSPNIIFDHADFEEAVRRGVMQCYDNTGQSCDAPTRMLLPQSRYNEAVEIAADQTRKVLTGDPTDPKNHLGPIVSSVHYERVQNYIKIGINEARLVAGGLGLPEGIDKGYFVKPTLFADVTNEMQIAREEIFGPVLVMIPFADEKEAIEIANDTNYGLAAHVSGEKDQAFRVAQQLRAGSIQVNGKGLGYDSPFGGYKQSGNGRECAGEIGFEDYLEIKTICM